MKRERVASLRYGCRHEWMIMIVIVIVIVIVITMIIVVVIPIDHEYRVGGSIDREKKIGIE